jgi:Uma2 family endonuclease
MSAQPHSYVSPEQYLARERAAAEKSEYIAGEIFAMAGASLAHNYIAVNALVALAARLRGSTCQPLGSDMRVQAGIAGPFFYPDISVVCGEPLLRPDAHLDTLQNPTVVIEVLSASTEARDRGEKSARYRRIATLEEILLVSQHTPRVERYTRQDGDDWRFTEFFGLDAEVRLDSIDCVLPLSEIYERVTFPTADGEGTSADEGNSR